MIGVSKIGPLQTQLYSLKHRHESLDLNTLVVLLSCSTEVRSKPRNYQFIPSLLSTNNSTVHKSDKNDKKHSFLGRKLRASNREYFIPRA